MKYNFKHIQKTHILQRYEADCGVACLLSIIQYHGGNESLERLREMSGTSQYGVSLLGLYQTASQMGFAANGVKGDIEKLKNQEEPVILHFSHEDEFDHYVVFYSYDEKKGFLIGDPSKKVCFLSEKEMILNWKSRNCLVLTPNEQFLTTKSINKKKKDLFLGMIKDDFRLLLFMVLLGMCVALLGMAMSIFSQKLIDNILPSHNTYKLIAGIALLTCLLLFRIGFMVLREFLTIKQSQDFNNRINHHFFNSLLHLPKIFFDNRKVGELTARLNDTHRVQDVIRTLVGNTILDIMVCLVSIVLLMIYSWQIALICIGSLPIYFYIIYRNRHKIISSQRAIMQAYAMNESNYIATMRGISTIKNDNKQTVFEENNHTIFSSFQDKIFRLGNINIRMSWQAGLAGVVFLIGILSITTVAVLHQELKLGELMAIIGITGSLLPSIGNLALVFIPINEAKVAFDRMYDIISIEKETAEGVEINELHSIALMDISFRFAGRQPLFQNVNITLTKGTVTAIIGESGNGKTTLANILQKFYPWENGKIIVNGELELQNIAIESWRSKMGVIPQEVYIFNGNILHNIVMEENVDQELLQTIIAKYGFEEFIQSLPYGLMTLIGEEGINLSGGQKQIIGLLRVLYRQPLFYILDEPTASLDKNSEQIVVEILKKLREDSIILLITHRLSMIDSIANVVFELVNGTVIQLKKS
jgi:ATP-binding cassette, subfamily C, bacteriocin exporter